LHVKNGSHRTTPGVAKMKVGVIGARPRRPVAPEPADFDTRSQLTSLGATMAYRYSKRVSFLSYGTRSALERSGNCFHTRFIL